MCIKIQLYKGYQKSMFFFFFFFAKIFIFADMPTLRFWVAVSRFKSKFWPPVRVLFYFAISRFSLKNKFFFRKGSFPLIPGHKNRLHIIKLRVGHTPRLFDLNACGEYLFGVNLFQIHLLFAWRFICSQSYFLHFIFIVHFIMTHNMIFTVKYQFTMRFQSF